MTDKTTPNGDRDDSLERETVSKSVGGHSDITKLATTLGGAALGNLLIPGVGGAIVGAIFGALIASKAAKDESNGN